MAKIKDILDEEWEIVIREKLTSPYLCLLKHWLLTFINSSNNTIHFLREAQCLLCGSLWYSHVRMNSFISTMQNIYYTELLKEAQSTQRINKSQYQLFLSLLLYWHFLTQYSQATIFAANSRINYSFNLFSIIFDNSSNNIRKYFTFSLKLKK